MYMLCFCTLCWCALTLPMGGLSIMFIKICSVMTSFDHQWNSRNILYMRLICLFWFFKSQSTFFSIMTRWVFLCWTSTKLQNTGFYSSFSSLVQSLLPRDTLLRTYFKCPSTKSREIVGRESWLLCLICLPGVLWWLSASSSRCHGVVCILWLWYFLIILTYYFWNNHGWKSSGLDAKAISEYAQEIPQSQIADKPVAPWGRVTQQSRDTRKTSKSKQPVLSSPSRWLQN